MTMTMTMKQSIDEYFRSLDICLKGTSNVRIMSWFAAAIVLFIRCLISNIKLTVHLYNVTIIDGYLSMSMYVEI